MADLVRFSVSMESDLLARFDRYCEETNVVTRSEAIRQLFNDAVTNFGWSGDAEDAAATLTLVYDHHRTQLLKQMMEIQHEHNDMVVSTTHIHLDHDTCLEIIILRGRAGAIQQLASRIRGLKGIQKGQLVLARAQGATRPGSRNHGHFHTHGQAQMNSRTVGTEK